MEINNATTLYVPDYYQIERGGLFLLIDPDTPNWIVTDKRGSHIVQTIKNNNSLNTLLLEYSNNFHCDPVKSWMEIHNFLHDLLRHRFLSHQQIAKGAYKGRAQYIQADKLNELWIHTNNSCNLACSHCLVESSPNGDSGLTTDNIKKIIDEAVMLGTHRFYFTGGEPFLRKDIFGLIKYICNEKKAELIILTNGTLLAGDVLERLQSYGKDRLRFQISLDGSRPEINDPIRGQGSFTRIVAGMKNLISAGFCPAITTVVMKQNTHDIPEITKLIAHSGGKTHHLLWLHKRGRIFQNGNDYIPSFDSLIEVIRKVKLAAQEFGITVDNLDSYAYRANSSKGTRYDLGDAGYDSLCVYSNGEVYPSAAFAGHKDMVCGSIHNQSLGDIWKKSVIANAFRNATLQHKKKCSGCQIRYICGGGDIEHSFFYSENGFEIKNNRFPENRGIQALDPYCDLHQELVYDAIFELAEERKVYLSRKTGFNSPVVLRSMGEGAIVCGEEDQSSENGRNGPHSQTTVTEHIVRTLHSNCVLSFDVDKPRRLVREFYGNAAENPQEDLCCPTKNDVDDTSHIPQEVLDRFYGCGSPITIAKVAEGETMVDLGSGAGIDCFIAAKKVGPTGKIYGIDMTDEMLRVANECNLSVSENLGYDVVEFKKGFLEKIPVDDCTADLITSNCVINLSPDKKMVFSEMWRILKDHGRIVISDIVSQEDTPSYLKANKQLWGECISGALTEDEFLAYLEQAGFYGLQIIQKVFWKEVEGYSFYSVTVRGYKYEKREGCVYQGQKAVYQGPFKAVIDEEGHVFPRNGPVEVCTDTAAKLSKPPYAGQFALLSPENEDLISYSCNSEEGTPCC